MKNRFLFLFSLFVLLANAQNTNKKVLFIGNSYTGYNNLASMCSSIATSVGDTLDYIAHTPGGAKLSTHDNNPQLTQLINSENWDYVTIQAQSQEPSFPTFQFNSQTLPFANNLVDKIKANNPCTEPMFFRTWGYKYGDAQNCPFAPWLCTYEGMDDSLSSRYNYMAKTNQSLLSPVGDVWRLLNNSAISFDLYDSDESHPSIYGSYAAACTFNTMFFKKDPLLITHKPNSISNADALIIKNAVKQVVCSNLQQWYVGKYNPVANFEYTIQDSVVQFTNTSLNGSVYQWNFGNNVATTDNPSNKFDSNGFYSVQLIVEKCNKADTIIKEIEIVAYTEPSVSVQNTSSANNTFFYSSDRNRIEFINSKLIYNSKVKIYSVTGKLEGNLNLTDGKLDISNLKKGIYYLDVQKKNKALYRIKIIKI